MKPTSRSSFLSTALALAILSFGGRALALGMPLPAAQDEEWVSQLPEFRFIASRLRESKNSYFGVAQRRRIERILGKDTVARNKRLLFEVTLARMTLKDGDVEGAVRAYEGIESRRPENWKDLPEFRRNLALGYLRLAENANCIANRNAGSCLFPLRDGGGHVEREPALAAREVYEAILEEDPANLEARWLLNLLALALEDYPDAVPEPLRLPESTYAAGEARPRMRDVAASLGVDAFGLCGGVVVEDFDGDGLLDILTSTYDPEGALTYYRSLGAGGFEDLSDASRASDQLGGLNLIAGDYDADGDPDVLVLRGAWLQDEGQIRNSLLRNDGGVFVDVTRDAGLVDPDRPTQTAAFLDFDGDGDLDLFIGNESRIAAGGKEGDFPCQLFANQGDGTFANVAKEAGIEGDRYCKGVAAGDYDNDGDVDLYLSNIGRNQLFRNEGDGTFVDVAEELGVQEPAGRSFATWFFDYDNDGWLDLFVAAYDANIGDLAAEALGLEHDAPSPRLYRNLGGTFRDVAAEVGLDRPLQPMGANFGDVDGDGWLDIYLTTGEPQLDALMPNVFLRNEGGERFVDETIARGLGHLQKGHGVAFADFDHDGDLDLYHQLGGFYRVDRFYNALFENPGEGNAWVNLELAGAGGNTHAVGARVLLVVTDSEGTREIHRAPGAVSSFGGSTSRLSIGLGAASAIERLEVTWPGADAPEVFTDVPLGAFLRVRQGSGAVERLERPRFAWSD